MTDLQLRGTPRSVDGTGEFRPILPGFHPDPTVCRVGDDYYLATSSFEYFPGAPIFHSRDLVRWRPIGNILDRREQFRVGRNAPSTGLYAPTLRHHGGRFWFITTNVSSFDDGQIIVSAEDPAGPWSDPVFVPEAIGIDPDLAWDDDGTCYLTWHDLDFVRGGDGIRQAPVDVATGQLLERPYPLWPGSGMPAAEGPHLYRIGDRWYLLLAEGGTERGHSVTIARSSSPRGPWEPHPENPIFTRRSSVHPVQNVGHADLVQTVDGEWAAVHLGARTRGSTPGFHVLGRETFLAGIDWVDGWPVFVPDAFDVPVADTAFVDRFAGDRLDGRWVVPGGESEEFTRFHPGRGLELRPRSGPTGLLCTRVLDLRWSAAVLFEGDGAFSVRLDDRHWAGLSVSAGRIRAEVRVGDAGQSLADVAHPEGEAELVISAVEPSSSPVPVGNAGPDEIVLSLRSAGECVELARLDGRYFSTEVASGFTGRMLAVAANGSPALLRSFSYRPTPVEG